MRTKWSAGVRGCLVLALFGAWTLPAWAAVSFTGAPYTHDFDTLPSSGTNPLPWTNDSTLEGWSLFRQPSPGTDVTAINVGTGTSNAGSFYSFGPSAGPDMALGGVGSSGAYFGNAANGTAAGWMAVALANDTGSTISSFTVKYDGEQWRNGGDGDLVNPPNAVAQTMEMEYGFGATFDAVPTWTAAGSAFNFTSPMVAQTAAALNGNDPANRSANLGGTISNVTWSANDNLWIRWIEKNDQNNDHGLAIDNFRLSVGSPPTADTISYNFNNETTLPPGWLTSSYGGDWVKEDTLGGRSFGGLAGVRATTPSYNGEGVEQPTLLVDAFSPEFTFSNLAQAVFKVNLAFFEPFGFSNTTLSMAVYRTDDGQLPGLFAPPAWGLLGMDVSDLEQNPTARTVNVLADALGGNIPANHVNNKTVYRIRTRLYDFDATLDAEEWIEMDDFSLSFAKLVLRGDYIANDVVDGADFLLWQREFGRTSGATADGDGNGQANANDLAVWKANLGKTRASLGGTAATSAGTIVPEPAAGILAAWGLIACRRRKHSYPPIA